MEKLRTYLNSLSTEQQSAYATDSGTTIGYLRKALSVNAKLDGALCRRLDENSGGSVPMASLRPDVFDGLEKAA